LATVTELFGVFTTTCYYKTESWMPLLNALVDEVLAPALMFRLLNLFFYFLY